jgi:hypothetical protein
MTDTPKPNSIEQRLRQDLNAVAQTISDATTHDSPRATPRTRRKVRKPLVALGVGAVVAFPAMAAAAMLHQGPEYVDTIPKSSIVMEGGVDGNRYLLVESRRADECGQPVTGVELVEENKNLLGSEWNTTGYEYGESVETDCGAVNDTSRFLTNPALFNDSGGRIGDSFVWVYAVHPDVTSVHITAADGYSKDLDVYEVDGAGYAPFEVPGGLEEFSSELLIGGQLVPGSAEDQKVRRP